MTIVTFALPQESHGFVRALTDRRRSWPRSPAPHLPMVRGRLHEHDILVVCTGIGTASAAATLKFMLSVEQPSQVISAGFAGGLDPALTLGAIVVATNYSASDFLPICAPHGVRFGALTTQPIALETAAQKARVAQETGAIAVDMETAAIAEACRDASVPLLSARAISDTADHALPVPLAHWFDRKRQRPRPFALAAFLAVHPARLPGFVRFLSGLRISQASLTKFLVGFLESRSRR